MVSSLDNSFGTSKHRTITLYCGDRGHKKVIKLKCSDRTCQECRDRIYWKLFKGWLELVSRMENPKLITVTTVNRQELKRSDIKLIRKQFIRLMRRKYYKDRITGGLYVIQLKNVGRGWNIHIHALIDTVLGPEGFLPQGRISRDWLEITKHSMVVHIRKADNLESDFKYILRYLAKPPEINGEVELYNEVLRGTRLIQTFGDLYGSRPDKPKLVCGECGCDWWISEFFLEKQLFLLKEDKK